MANASKDLDEKLVQKGLESASVLLADDSAFMLELMTAMLKAFGVSQIDKAPDGERALAMIKEFDFDLVIADWQMEPMDGHAFLKTIRHDMRGADQRMPVVMCTAHTDRKRVLMLRDAGATEILTKPVSPASVYEKVVSALFKPRPFVVSDTYVGPCRRRRQARIDFTDRRRRNLAETPNLKERLFL